jgi:hypothetical protein
MCDAFILASLSRFKGCQVGHTVKLSLIGVPTDAPSDTWTTHQNVVRISIRVEHSRTRVGLVCRQRNVPEPIGKLIFWLATNGTEVEAARAILALATLQPRGLSGATATAAPSPIYPFEHSESSAINHEWMPDDNDIKNV